MRPTKLLGIVWVAIEAISGAGVAAETVVTSAKRPGRLCFANR